MKITTVTPVDFRKTGDSYDVVCVFQDDTGGEFKEWVPFANKDEFLQRVKNRVLQLQQEDINAVDLKILMNQPIDVGNSEAESLVK